ncbi:MAG: CDF family Co(II)/Ni(II) efflux transporter DmeF [Kofleriaceae bacterium]
MHEHDLGRHTHRHDDLADVSHGERRTRYVVVLTALMMSAELAVGWWTGSMALLADGWHMATHAGALGLALFAYRYARAHAGDRAFSFGTGKVYGLAGYTSGVALAMIALWMAVESIARLASPRAIDFADALPVAIAGLAVNLASVVLLGHGHDHHGHDHDHGHNAHDHHEHDHHDHHDHDDHHEHDHHDHNLRAAYVHVLADALTSVLAIGALLAGHYAGWWFLDPVMGIVGGAVILRWSIDLCRRASRQLLDLESSSNHAGAIRARLEAIDDVRVADLHLWELGPQRTGCIVSVVTSTPRDIEDYRAAVRAAAEVSHLTVEIQRCDHGAAPAAAAS